MANNYQILSEDAIKYLCGLIRNLASVSEGIDNINLADNKTFSNIYIKNMIDKCLEDANAEAEKLVGALTHLICKETAIQPTLDNSEINVIYLYSADGNPPYQQFLKISEDKLVDLGSTSISLEDYIKAADVAKDYATKVELKAVTDKIGITTLTTTDTTITGAIEEVNAKLGELINDTKATTTNTFSSDKIKAIANEIRKFTLSKTDYQGVEAYPTECGVYRVTKEIDGVPNNASNYAALIIYGNGYFTHIYHDNVSGRIWIGYTADSVKAPTWQELATMDKVAHEVDTSYMSNGVLNILAIRQALGAGCYEIIGQGNARHGSIRLNIWQVASGAFAFSCCITDASGVRSICNNDGESPTVDVGTSYFANTNRIVKIF